MSEDNKLYRIYKNGKPTRFAYDDKEWAEFCKVRFKGQYPRSKWEIREEVKSNDN